MGAKVTVTTTTIVAALLFLTIGAGGGYVVGSKRSDRNRPFATSREMAGNSLPEPEADPPVLNPTPESTTLAPPAATPAAANSLLARLDRFKEWHKDHAAKLKYRTPQDFERTFLLLKEELDGVRELILADPAPFLEWVGRKEHGPYLEDLFHATISLKRSAWSVDVQEFSALPSPLTDGLLKLLESGSVPQRRAVMAVAPYLRNASPEFRNQYVALLSESYDPGIGPAAVNALLFAHEPSPRELDAVVDYAMQLNEPAVRLQVFRSLGKVPREETRTWLLETLESNRLSDPEGRLAYCALEWWTYPGNSPGRDFEERAARLLGAAMERTTEHDPYFMNLHTALNLPLDLSIRLLEQAAASGPNAAVKKAAEAVLQRAKKSGASQTVLREAWIAEFKQK